MARQLKAGVWLWVGAALLLAIVALCGVAGYRMWAVVAGMWEDVKPQPPHITLQGQVVNGRLEFHLTYDPAALGVSALTVLDAADNPLWRIDGGGLGKVPVIVYGQVPVEPGVRWFQQIPADGPPPAAPRGQPVKVVLEWKFSGGSWVGSQRSETVVNLPD
jgi:hypothetical protein